MGLNVATSRHECSNVDGLIDAAVNSFTVLFCIVGNKREEGYVHVSYQCFFVFVFKTVVHCT